MSKSFKRHNYNKELLLNLQTMSQTWRVTLNFVLKIIKLLFEPNSERRLGHNLICPLMFSDFFFILAVDKSTKLASRVGQRSHENISSNEFI